MAIATLRRFSLLTLLMGTLLSATQAAAEQMVRVGEYEIHYNAIETRFLTPEVAQANSIQRSIGHGLRVFLKAYGSDPDGQIAALDTYISAKTESLQQKE